MGQWTEIITPDANSINSQFKNLWKYRDLALMLVKRDFILYYKQTILGPAWFVLQPLLTVTVFTFVFGKMAKISTDGLPHILFYLSGISCWNYFADSFKQISGMFIENQSVYNKVYFPRLVIPVSIVLSNLLKLGIYLVLFGAFYLYYFFNAYQIRPNISILLLPLLILNMAILAMGTGIFVASLTYKYRDLKFLLNFGVQLLMYMTPIIYPLSATPEKYRFFFLLNPMTIIIETFKYGFLGRGGFSVLRLVCGITTTAIIFCISLVLFTRTEKNFIDTV